MFSFDTLVFVMTDRFRFDFNVIERKTLYLPIHVSTHTRSAPRGRTYCGHRSCIMALRRFQARNKFNNGINFVGAERELRGALETSNQAKISNELTTIGIRWIFNPPAAQWFGGTWEALVSSNER